MTITKPRFDPALLNDEEEKKQEPPKYAVILRNDNHHSMEQVVCILIDVMSFTTKKAVECMLEAHRTGRSIVALTHFERAEFYTTRLKDKTLVAEMEKV